MKSRLHFMIHMNGTVDHLKWSHKKDKRVSHNQWRNAQITQEFQDVIAILHILEEVAKDLTSTSKFIVLLNLMEQIMLQHKRFAFMVYLIMKLQLEIQGTAKSQLPTMDIPLKSNAMKKTHFLVSNFITHVYMHMTDVQMRH